MQTYLGYFYYEGTTKTLGVIISREHDEHSFRERTKEVFGPFYGAKVEIIEGHLHRYSSHPYILSVPDIVFDQLDNTTGHFTWFTLTHRE